MAEAINPIVTNIARDEVISDPFVREAYFGSPDTPGIISQAITAANRAFGQPAILRQTAGLSPLELAAMQGAYGGLGSYQPYLDASTRAYQEGMGMSRRAGELAQPYFAGEQAYLGAATDTARRAAGMQFDPNLTRQFFDPFEDRVVQQTIDDVFTSWSQRTISWHVGWIWNTIGRHRRQTRWISENYRIRYRWLRCWNRGIRKRCG